uniref:DNA replication checkpoint mediator MRC1 domain-containing protein n=1 Tax=Picocystis salinarum TaxID=88271 RepID=A0A6U9Q7D3_9CHLO|mmetsp:Transcript_2377/g.15911  ORF Transcript_2377/g.15911 Transcript_2377/m.15911 type:complete len:872 (-) Transcript_2377:4229-6844(-)
MESAILADDIAPSRPMDGSEECRKDVDQEVEDSEEDDAVVVRTRKKGNPGNTTRTMDDDESTRREVVEEEEWDPEQVKDVVDGVEEIEGERGRQRIKRKRDQEDIHVTDEEEDEEDEEAAIARKLRVAKEQGKEWDVNLWGNQEEEDEHGIEDSQDLQGSETNSDSVEDDAENGGKTYKLKPYVPSSPNASQENGNNKSKNHGDESPKLHAETQRILRERANRACVGGGNHEIQLKPLSGVLQKLQHRKEELGKRKNRESAANANRTKQIPIRAAGTPGKNRSKGKDTKRPILTDQEEDVLEIIPPTQAGLVPNQSPSTLPPTAPMPEKSETERLPVSKELKMTDSSSRELFASGSDSLANQDSLPATWFLHRTAEPHYDEDKRERMTPKKQAMLPRLFDTPQLQDSAPASGSRPPRDFNDSEVEEEDLLSEEDGTAHVPETAPGYESGTDSDRAVEEEESDHGNNDEEEALEATRDREDDTEVEEEEEEVDTDEEDFLGDPQHPSPQAKRRGKPNPSEENKAFEDKYRNEGAKAFIDDAAELSDDEQNPPASDEEYDGDDNEEDQEVQKMISNKNSERKGDEEIRAKMHQRWAEQEDDRVVQGIVEGVRKGFRRKRQPGMLGNEGSDDEDGDRAARRRARERAGEAESSEEEDEGYDPALRALKIGQDDEWSEGDKSDDEAFKLHFQVHIAGEEAANTSEHLHTNEDPFPSNFRRIAQEADIDPSSGEEEAAPTAAIGMHAYRKSGFLASESLGEGSRSVHRGNSRAVGGASRGYIFRADDSKDAPAAGTRNEAKDKGRMEAKQASALLNSNANLSPGQGPGRFSALFDVLNKQKSDQPGRAGSYGGPWKVNAALKKALGGRVRLISPQK